MPAFPLSHRLYRFRCNVLELIFLSRFGRGGKLNLRRRKEGQRRFRNLVRSLCNDCGILIDGPGFCRDCHGLRLHFRILRPGSVFEDPIRKPLPSLSIAAQPSEFAMDWKRPVDMILRVPLSKKRTKERGYNQVSLIAPAIALAAGTAFVPEAPNTVRETRSQVGLTKAKRRLTVSGAFLSQGKCVKCRLVLLMDEVATTGSTLMSCAEALYAAGARDVFALSASRVPAQHGSSGIQAVC